MKNKFLIFMATITFFLTVAVVGILLKPELYESKTTVIKENNSGGSLISLALTFSIVN